MTQITWTNPGSYRRPVELLTIAAAGLALLGGGAEPFYQLDFPNPRGAVPGVELRTWTQNLLETTLVVTPAPFYQLDYPNPRGTTPAISLRTFTDATRLQLVGRDQFFGAPGQGVAQLDWPNPRGAARASDLGTWTQNLSQSTLAPSTQAPFYQLDYPNPRGSVSGIALRTFLDPTKLQLIGKDTFFGGPGQGPAQLDWPNPRGAARASDLGTWTQNLSQSTLAPSFAPPFYQLDYPNPRGATPGVSLRTHVDPTKLQLIGQDTFFGGPGQGPAQLDWPVPAAPGRSISLRTWTQSVLQLPFGLLPPFLPVDAPNPRGPTAGIDLRTWTQDLSQSTLAPVVAPPFFRHLEYPNPRGYTPGISLRTFVDPTKLHLIGKDTFFGGPGQGVAQLDWPVTRRVPRAISLLTWTQDLTRFTLTPFVQPPLNRHIEWPNPRGYTYSITLRGSVLPAIIIAPPTTWTDVAPAAAAWSNVATSVSLWTDVPIAI